MHYLTFLTYFRGCTENQNQTSPSGSSDSGYDSNLYENPVIRKLVFDTAERYTKLDEIQPGSHESRVQASGLAAQINRWNVFTASDLSLKE